MIEDRYVDAKQPADESPSDQFLRMKPVNKKWSVVERSVHGSAGTESVELDRAGNPKLRVDAQGNVTSTQYNELGKATQTVLPSGHAEVRDFNAFGQCTLFIDRDGNETRYSYDLHARLTQKTESDGKMTRYEYDERGFPSRSTIEDRVYRFEFDDWGRLLHLYKADGREEVWTYDNAGQLIEHLRLGIPYTDGDEPVQAEDASAESRPKNLIRYEYGPRGRLISIANGEENERLQYDPDGFLARRIKPDGSQVRFMYDRAGRLHRRMDPKRRFDEYTYYPSGRVKRHRFREAEGAWELREYDKQGQLVMKKSTDR